MSRRITLILFLFQFMLAKGMPSQIQAAPPNYTQEESQIPTKPSPPPALAQKNLINSPHCERIFTYRGKKWECDSHTGQDAERLRPILIRVPQALEELDAYQENREKAKVGAYAGTVGIFLVAVGYFMRGPLSTLGLTELGGYSTIAGLLIGVGGAGYTVGSLYFNHIHLDHAVEYYNTAYPRDPIKFEFSTKFNF